MSFEERNAYNKNLMKKIAAICRQPTKCKKNSQIQKLNATLGNQHMYSLVPFDACLLLTKGLRCKDIPFYRNVLKIFTTCAL